MVESIKNMKTAKSQFFSTREETIKWLVSHKIKNYTINDDLTIDVDGNVNISNANLKKIPVKFGKVTGNFYCYNNNLISLTGSPKSVDGDFWCQNNHLTSLAGSPESIDGNFWCNHNKLINLIRSPKSIDGNFWCVDNPITSLIEVINCNFKKDFYFSIDKKKFEQKELIQTLEQYYDNGMTRYELTNSQFSDIIKPQIEKEILQEKLNTLKAKVKTKTNFI